ncbi:S1/P1 nuclease [Pseudomonas eucalypticola]|uniref:S1/P1 nuclease n=1 Tax=Pseudomonas eucalypticola TaxID=2599595 RepID=UPI001AD90120|nr:S1/P1 nuclease [Pseudomonas eucalypticola]
MTGVINTKAIVQVLVLSGLLCWFSDACAWGREGHKVVAIIAEGKLTPRARAEVTAILNVEGETSISQIASWADDVRTTEPDLPSHAVRIPFAADAYDPDRDCAKKRECVIKAIDDVERTLGDSRSSPESKVRALKFLVHYVGDIHQPLHTIKETGAMSVEVDGKAYKLHKVWDTLSVRNFHMSPQAIAVSLTRKGGAVVQGTPVKWAEETHQIAKNYVYHGDERLAASDSMSIQPDYLDAIRPVVEGRLYAAGVRLAGELNRIFGAEYH